VKEGRSALRRVEGVRVAEKGDVAGEGRVSSLQNEGKGEEVEGGENGDGGVCWCVQRWKE
jgi:hypothetical protein